MPKGEKAKGNGPMNNQQGDFRFPNPWTEDTITIIIRLEQILILRVGVTKMYLLIRSFPYILALRR